MSLLTLKTLDVAIRAIEHDLKFSKAFLARLNRIFPRNKVGNKKFAGPQIDAQTAALAELNECRASRKIFPVSGLRNPKSK
jgi:uncharacterized protein YcbK (DUF882 family)